jgi:hypothetical protein
MLKQITSAAAAIMFFCVPAMAASVSGKYIYNRTEICFDPNTGLSASAAMFSGILAFDGSGTVTLSTFHAGGWPLNLNTESGNEPYSTTDSTITLGGETFQAAYGGVKSGVASFVSFIAVLENGTCEDIGTLTLQTQK